MVTIARIGIDTSKGSFQLHGVDAEEQVVLRKTLRRRQFLEYMAKQEVDGDRAGGVRGVAPLGAGRWVSWGTGWCWCRRST